MRRVNVFGYAMAKYDGYGSYVLETIRALAHLGVDVMPGRTDVWDLPGWIQRMQGWDFSRLNLSIMPGHMAKPLPGRHWLLSMTESTSCDPSWPGNINRCGERLIVPCQQNVDAFKSRGVQIPIHVVPGGVNAEEFPLLPNVERDRPFTFMALGDRGNRKNFMTVHQAFFQAFPADPNVRLVIKCRAESLEWLSSLNFPDKRVSLWRENVENPSDIYAQADCYVFPSSGEGWGLPPREAACMGVPVIATRWGGLDDELDCWAFPLDKITFAPVPATMPHLAGEWAIPDVNEVAERMSWIYKHPQAAKNRALEHAAWLRQNRTWEHSAKKLIALMEEYA